MNPCEFKQWRHEWQQGQRSHPLVMGILNRTEDSFSDGGRYMALSKARDHALQLLADGADMLDIGGESSRPGAKGISLDEELSRVIPLIETIRQLSDVVLSIDTCKPEVMSAAVATGASMINDISALRSPEALHLAVSLNVPVCLMHMQGEPGNMQNAPYYPEGVVQTLKQFFNHQRMRCLDAGIAQNNIIFDPGFGFGKTLRHNLSILSEMGILTAQRFPLLLGVSRKHSLGLISGQPIHKRMAAGLVAGLTAIDAGAAILRTHDVAETVQALLMRKMILEHNVESEGKT